MKDVEVIGQSLADNVAHRLVGFLRFALQKLPKTSRQRAVESSKLCPHSFCSAFPVEFAKIRFSGVTRDTSFLNVIYTLG